MLFRTVKVDIAHIIEWLTKGRLKRCAYFAADDVDHYAKWKIEMQKRLERYTGNYRMYNQYHDCIRMHAFILYSFKEFRWNIYYSNYFIFHMYWFALVLHNFDEHLLFK